MHVLYRGLRLLCEEQPFQPWGRPRRRLVALLSIKEEKEIERYTGTGEAERAKNGRGPLALGTLPAAAAFAAATTPHLPQLDS